MIFFAALESLPSHGIIQSILEGERYHGFYSTLVQFTGDDQPILDLKVLNKFLKVQKFRMEST